MKQFYVYKHILDGIIFYVGSASIREYRQGKFNTKHERAFHTWKRTKSWKDFVNNRPFNVEIFGYYDSRIESEKAELQLIHTHRETLVNVKGANPVFQFSLDGKFVKEWMTAKEASEYLGINRHSINSCVLGLNPGRHSAGGFKWSYSERKGV